MFTGIIEEVGVIRSIKKGSGSALLSIQAKAVLEDLKAGDSVAVNGICLTAVSVDTDCFTADVMNETLSRTSLAGQSRTNRVNLERALSAGGRFGGHMVSGHIDGTGRITAIRRDGIAVWYTIRTTPEIMHYIIEKGSVAIDGISLTVAAVSAGGFSVSVIPHTAGQTILSEQKVGAVVNLENDMLGKYVEKLLRR
jgi:riboflavin synthase, alpha subunit